MTNEQATAGASSGGVSPFEAIRHEDDAGGEFWSARELARVLGYTQWRNFAAVVVQAQVACAKSGQPFEDHFAAVSKMVTLGSRAARSIPDWHLSRYACYLVVQNADPDKPIVALGQTYFAVQTRRAELADDLADELAALPEAQRRLRMRNEVVGRNVPCPTFYNAMARPGMRRLWDGSLSIVTPSG
jgi:DNA-damage-inducible protein D